MNEWISVKKKLPKMLSGVIVVNEENQVHEALYENGFWYFGEKVNVTHWMPLPEPSRGGKAMNIKNPIGKAITSLGVCGVVGLACWVMRSASPIWALITLIFIWEA